MKIIRCDDIYNVYDYKNKIVGYYDEIQDVYGINKKGYAEKIGTANNLGHALDMVEKWIKSGEVA